jgi:pyruvate formate lyase activating enzyme
MAEKKLAMMWKDENKGVRCNLCARRCFILEGKRGFCMVRENIKGKLFSLNYGKIVGLNVDPIEKKPLFHFLPASSALSYACRGCNFRCQYCCNWEISHDGLPEIFGQDYAPEQIVELAIKNNCPAISHTYTEPTIFYEFAFDVAKFAHKKNIKNTFVTNGYMTPEALENFKYLDAATVDFKASGDETFLRKYASVPSSEPIFAFLKELKKHKIHTEITNLIVPKIGDDLEKFRKLVKWVVDELGIDVPFHILRFFPTYKMLTTSPTPVAILEKFFDEAMGQGLNYVYVGNAPGKKENTYCPNCKELLIERIGFESRIVNLKKDRCGKCNEKTNIVLS